MQSPSQPYQFDPIPMLDAEAARTHRAPVPATPDALRAWQTAMRERLADCLDVPTAERPALVAMARGLRRGDTPAAVPQNAF